MMGLDLIKCFYRNLATAHGVTGSTLQRAEGTCFFFTTAEFGGIVHLEVFRGRVS
jgi:hypothetical protein